MIVNPSSKAVVVRGKAKFKRKAKTKEVKTWSG
jgi:hypothetical protein